MHALNQNCTDKEIFLDTCCTRNTMRWGVFIVNNYSKQKFFNVQQQILHNVILRDECFLSVTSNRKNFLEADVVSILIMW